MPLKPYRCDHSAENTALRAAHVGRSAAADILVADEFVRRESDGREEGLRRAAFHPEKSNRLKYNSG